MDFLTGGGRVNQVRFVLIAMILIASLALAGQWTTYMHPVTDEFIVEEAGYAVGVAFLWLFAMNAVRRLHDRSHSGYGVLFGLLPGVNVMLLLYLVFSPSSPGTNKYGPSSTRNPYRVAQRSSGFTTEEELARQERRNRRFLNEDGSYDFDALFADRQTPA